MAQAFGPTRSFSSSRAEPGSAMAAAAAKSSNTISLSVERTNQWYIYISICNFVYGTHIFTYSTKDADAEKVVLAET